MRRKHAKIEQNITLSIQYARLLEEISETQLKNLALDDKKGVVNLSKRKMNENNKYVEQISDIINEIENKYKSKEYKIIINNQLDKYLTRLSNYEYFEMVKYNIAINTILDSTIDYQNSEKFLESISGMLFQDKSMIKSIQKKLSDIYLIFNENHKASKTTDIVNKIPINLNMGLQLIKKKYKFLPSPVIAQAIIISLGSGKKIIQKRGQLKKLRMLSDTEFEYILTTTLLCLVYAKKVLSEVEHKKYFSSKLKAINSARTTIFQEFFEQWYDIKENEVKISLLKTFDDYLIKEIKFHTN